MRTYKVKVRQTRVVEIEVEAPDYMAARDAALKRIGRTVVVQSNAGWEYNVVAGGVRQTSEPWVEGGWYDQNTGGDVVVLSRAPGNVFKASDIELLSDRLTELGLKVIDSWNGAGVDSVSFQCDGRKGTGPMSKAWLAKLLAPRP